MTTQTCLPLGVDVLADVDAQQAAILTPEALAFVADLERAAPVPGVSNCCTCAAGARPGSIAASRPKFLPETVHVRDSDWRIAPLPGDLQDRRVEITGPVDRKMVINALNSAPRFMADFEDAHSPTWHAMIAGQVNLRDAVRRTI